MLKHAIWGFVEHGDLSRGAAIAFYTVTSLAPLLLIVIALAGLFIGNDAARTGVIDEFAGLVGPEGADLIKSIVARSSDPASGTASTVIGAVTVLVTASGIFGEMQTALNTTWEVRPPDEPWRSLIRARAASLGLIAALGFVTIVSLAASAALSALGQELAMRTPAGSIVLTVLNTGLSLAVFTVLFAAIYKLLPDTPLRWRDVGIGAVVTASLFTGGKSRLVSRSSSARVNLRRGGCADRSSAMDLLLGPDFSVRRRNHQGDFRHPRVRCRSIPGSYHPPSLTRFHAYGRPRRFLR